MITKGIKQLVAEAEAEIETLSAEDAIALVDEPDVEARRHPRYPGAVARRGCPRRARHVPRGMIEFWIDPASP